MKKFICIFLTIFCVIIFAGCSNSLSNIIKDNMSDMRINFFEGENNLFFADLSCGYREETFAYDGISTAKKQCGVLSVEFKNTYSYSQISVTVNIDGNKKDYVLERSPFENKYMVDLEKIIENDKIIEINLKNQLDICTLKCVSNSWNIQYEKAIEIGVKKYQTELEKLYFNGKLNAEGYLKIISKPNYDKKFWYFSFIDKASNSKSMLIDVSTGEITINEKK